MEAEGHGATGKSGRERAAGDDSPSKRLRLENLKVKEQLTERERDYQALRTKRIGFDMRKCE